ncbi:hypothetical protein YPPY13_3102, partial [Yersinia pestis PY-13]
MRHFKGRKGGISQSIE